MINFKHDTSNNISFPSENRKVMLLLGGKYYRLEINKKEIYYKENGEKKFLDNLKIHYRLYEDSSDTHIAKADMTLFTENDKTYKMHEFYYNIGFSQIPSDFFFLDKIEVDKNHRGIGSEFFNYIINDIQKFIAQNNQKMWIMFQRTKNGENEHFYKKFGAQLNSDVKMNEISDPKLKDFYSKVEFMTIKNPQTVGEVPKELADDFDYKAAGLNNPFERSQNQPE